MPAHPIARAAVYGGLWFALLLFGIVFMKQFAAWYEHYGDYAFGMYWIVAGLLSVGAEEFVRRRKENGNSSRSN